MSNGDQTANDNARSERTRQNALGVFAFLILVTAIAAYAIHRDVTPAQIALIGFIAFSTIIIAFAAVVLWEIIDGKINLNGIISESRDVLGPEGEPKASLSRFQFLVFTFVVAGLFLMLSIEAGTFVNIPETVLGLIGLSGGGFVVSKAVGKKKNGTTGGNGGNANGNGNGNGKKNGKKRNGDKGDKKDDGGVGGG